MRSFVILVVFGAVLFTFASAAPRALKELGRTASDSDDSKAEEMLDLFHEQLEKYENATFSNDNATEPSSEDSLSTEDPSESMKGKERKRRQLEDVERGRVVFAPVPDGVWEEELQLEDKISENQDLRLRRRAKGNRKEKIDEITQGEASKEESKEQEMEGEEEEDVKEVDHINEAEEAETGENKEDNKDEKEVTKDISLVTEMTEAADDEGTEDEGIEDEGTENERAKDERNEDEGIKDKRTDDEEKDGGKLRHRRSLPVKDLCPNDEGEAKELRERGK